MKSKLFSNLFCNLIYVSLKHNALIIQFPNHDFVLLWISYRYDLRNNENSFIHKYVEAKYKHHMGMN